MKTITKRMVSLVESEAAKCRAQSMSKMQFAADWGEVAEALEAAVELMKIKFAEEQNASRRCG